LLFGRAFENQGNEILFGHFKVTFFLSTIIHRKTIGQKNGSKIPLEANSVDNKN
jgi:hypothetical protein